MTLYKYEMAMLYKLKPPHPSITPGRDLHSTTQDNSINIDKPPTNTGTRLPLFR